MILAATTDSLQVKLGEAITTTNPTFLADYADLTASSFTGGASFGDTNGTTAVTLVAAPAASTVRQPKSVLIMNVDTVSHVVIVQHNHSGTVRSLIKITVPADNTLGWTPDRGWFLINSTTIGANTLALSSLVNATQRAFIGAAAAGAWSEQALSANVFTMLGSADNAAIRSNIGAVNVAGDTITGALTCATVLRVGTASPFMAGLGTVGIQNAAGSATTLSVVGDGAGGNFILYRISADAVGPTLTIAKYRGSAGSNGQTLSGDQLGSIAFQGWGSDAAAHNGGSFNMVPLENFTGTGAGTQWQLNVCAIGATTQTNVLRADVANGFSMFGANIVIDAQRIYRNLILTVATLPAGVQGMRTMVNNALAPAFNAAVVGGGAVTVPVFYNGAAWNVG